MSIDIERLKVDAAYWDSVAPEGATHFSAHESDEDWWKQDGQCMYDWKGGIWRERLLWPKSLIPRPKPQSSEWDGKSAPAPGDQAKTSGGRCSVLAWDARRNKVAVQWHDGELGVVSAEALKPLRTKEQREREELREDLEGILPFCEYDQAQIKELSEILYAQGYRKPEER